MRPVSIYDNSTYLMLTRLVPANWKLSYIYYDATAGVVDVELIRIATGTIVATSAATAVIAIQEAANLANLYDTIDANMETMQ